METTHRIHIGDARDLGALRDGSVHLVVTSPPYPMIEMWDEAFSAMNPRIRQDLDAQQGLEAFERMHQELDRVWAECFRVLAPGGFACINIGDATRTVAKTFRMYHNHVRIVSSMVNLGFNVLPDILWRKPTNAPNKFMGSGMLPAGAYVTYEHEYILVFRKGDKRVFATPAERERRRRSAFFWEERNLWFSDVWTLVSGTRQKLKGEARSRSAAYPFEIPFRLINMYSAQGDTVLDPFAGTGTTLAAAVALGRSSVGVEISPRLRPLIEASLQEGARTSGESVRNRLAAHRRFVEERLTAGKTVKHHNVPHGLAVMTQQERTLELLSTTALRRTAQTSWRPTRCDRVSEPQASVTRSRGEGSSLSQPAP